MADELRQVMMPNRQRKRATMTPTNTAAEEDAMQDLAAEMSAAVAKLAAADGAITVDMIAALAARAVPHAEHVAITVMRPNHPPVTTAASSDVPVRVDALQYDLREGPCLDAATEWSVALSDDVGHDPRWPTFGPRCVKTTGIRSMLGLRLPVQGEEHAAINYYSAEAATFGDADIQVASVIVPITALVIEAGIRQIEQENFAKALASSRHISTAIGIVMATRKVNHEEAFAMLRRASMDLNRKLSDVADDINFSGSVRSNNNTAKH